MSRAGSILRLVDPRRDRAHFNHLVLYEDVYGYTSLLRMEDGTVWRTATCGVDSVFSRENFRYEVL